MWSVRSMSGIGSERPAPNISAAGDLLGELVDAGGAEDVARPERLDHRPQVDQAVERVRVRVAEVDGGRVAVAVGEDRAEAGVDLGERLVPGRLDELAVAADEGRREPVGVRVELADAGALRADEAVAEDVVGVAADLDDLAALERHLEPAGRLAERAGSVVSRGWPSPRRAYRKRSSHARASRALCRRSDRRDVGDDHGEHRDEVDLADQRLGHRHRAAELGGGGEVPVAGRRQRREAEVEEVVRRVLATPVAKKARRRCPRSRRRGSANAIPSSR